ncbi:MAG TPA: hypothetical protein VIC25_03920, partial [Caulobacteraceae bacterium]
MTSMGYGAKLTQSVECFVSAGPCRKAKKGIVMRLKFMLPAIVAVAGLVAASGASAVTNSYFLGYTPSGTQTLTINGSQVLRA